MSYNDKHGITFLGNGLSISLDQDGPCDPKYPVILLTVGETEHYHAPLTREASAELLLWLQQYLQATSPA